MDKFTSDATIIASAYNAVSSGETVFSPLLCGTMTTWKQRRLFESAMLLAQGYEPARQNVERFRSI